MLSLGGCSLFDYLNFSKPTPGSGTMIVRHGSYIYRIGGMDEVGSVSSEILMAKINLDGSGQPMPLEWTGTGFLPEGRAFGAAFAAGNLMYVLGGIDDNDPTTTVFMTRINADGTLGYGASRDWERSPMPLASPRSHMAWVLHDGRVFLVGGRNATGPESSIVLARFYESTGRLGQWYESPQKLPSRVHSAGAAVLDGRLEIVGGIHAFTRASDGHVSYLLGPDGLLSDPRYTVLPKALAYPLCVADGDSLLVGGGYDSDFMPSSTVYRFRNGSWTTADVSLEAEGPTYGKAAGTLWFAKPPSEEGLVGIGKAAGFSPTPERLVVIPGSGLGPRNAIIYMKPEPGTTIRYRTDLEEVGAGDPLWNLDTTNRITGDISRSFRSFTEDGSAGEQVRMQYRIRPTGFFSWISGNLPLKGAGAALDTINVSDNLFDPTSTGYSSAWGRLNLSQPALVELTFADTNSPGMSAVYSGRIRLTLYEDDLYTEVLDIYGAPVRNCTTETVSAPILLKLNPGSYHLLIEDRDGQTGRTFGLAFRQR